MGNSLKEIFDKSSMMKDITDRVEIIQNYQNTGYLDRNKAIQMIKELRLTDNDVCKATVAGIAVGGSVPFDQISDQGIINELKMQVAVLTAKLRV